MRSDFPGMNTFSARSLQNNGEKLRCVRSGMMCIKEKKELSKQTNGCITEESMFYRTVFKRKSGLMFINVSQNPIQSCIFDSICLYF